MIAHILTDMFVICSSLWIIFNAILSCRSNKIYSYQEYLRREINKAILEDINNNNENLWRFDMLRSVSYNEMLYKFWREPSSFYPDKSFIKPTVKINHPSTSIFK